MTSQIPNTKFPFRLFFLFFPAIALLILAGAWYVGYERIASELEITRSNEIGTLVKEKAVIQAIDAGNKEAESGMASAFASLIAFNEMYDKVRWIDQNGIEWVRVNNVTERAENVPPDKLQNLSGSYYFISAMQL